jgi:hypothetical protein
MVEKYAYNGEMFLNVKFDKKIPSIILNLVEFSQTMAFTILVSLESP